MAVKLNLRRISVKEYHQMGESHILHPEERVELIMGQIIRMSPIGTKHANLVDMLNLILVEN